MLTPAIRDLSSGKPVLLYDLDSRERETDMIIAAEHMTPGLMARLRNEAGGLICAAIPKHVAGELGLPYLHTIYRQSDFPALQLLSSAEMPYGGRPAFSITLNHRENYTGVTDEDRAQTARELANMVREMGENPEKDWKRILAKRFRSPGHLHLLIAGGLEERMGHTDLSVRMAEIAGLVPVVVVCEMLDGNTHRALTKESAQRYARQNDMNMIQASDILKEDTR